MYDRLTGTLSRLDQVLMRHAATHPERAFAEHGERRYTYGQLAGDAAAISTALIHTGVAAGDIVSVLVMDQIDYISAMFGILLAGAVVNPCSNLLSEDELAYQLSHAGPVAIICDPAHRDAVDDARGAAGIPARIIVTGAVGAPPADQGESLTDLVAANADLGQLAPDRTITAEDLAIIMYTSGTTARPKGVMFTHGNFMTCAIENARERGWSADDRFLHYFPMYHASGGFGSLAPAVFVGATIVFIEHFSASRFARQLHEFRITLTSVNSTHVRMIMNQPRTPYDGDHPCSRMHYGLKLEPGEIEEFERTFNTTLYSNYGMTESIGTCVVDAIDGVRRAGAAGRIRNGYELSIVDADGNACPPDVHGEIIIRPLHRHFAAVGYFKDPKATSDTFRDDGIHSGDVGFMDADGYVYFVERSKDMIKRSGFNLSPAEVERVLLAHETVKEAAVVGIPDPFREEAIVAFVVTAEGVTAPTADALIQWCAASLAPYKVPGFVYILAEMPKNFVGKIEKQRLRSQALDLTAAQTRGGQ